MQPGPAPFLFYKLASPPPPAVLPPGFSFEFWRPSFRRPLAPGLSPLTAAVWFVFHTLRLFANRDYAAGIVWHGGRVAHVTMAFPGFFRFPFMAPADIQFGALFTEPEFRGRGLAGAALAELVRHLAQPSRRFWYITHESNHASQQVAGRSGYRLIGRGDKLPRFGLRFLGRYVVTQPL